MPSNNTHSCCKVTTSGGSVLSRGIIHWGTWRIFSTSRLVAACNRLHVSLLVFATGVITVSTIIPFHGACVIFLLPTRVLRFFRCFLIWMTFLFGRLFLFRSILFLLRFVSCLSKIITKNSCNCLLECKNNIQLMRQSFSTFTVHILIFYKHHTTIFGVYSCFCTL